MSRGPRRIVALCALLMGAALPDSPAWAMGIEMAVPQNLGALRPYVARHLLGAEGASMEQAALELRMPELASRIDEFMIANGPSLERMNDGRPLEGFEAALAQARLEVQDKVRTQAEAGLGQIQAALEQLERSQTAPDGAQIQVSLTMAEALQNYRRHYLDPDQQARLDEYLMKLRQARISHKFRAADIERVSAGIETGLEMIGLPANGGFGAISNSVRLTAEAVEISPSLLVPAGTYRARISGAPPRDTGLRRHIERHREQRAAQGPAASADADRALTLQVDLQEIAARAMGLDPADFAFEFVQGNIAAGEGPLGEEDYLRLMKALEEVRAKPGEIGAALAHELARWDRRDWRELKYIFLELDSSVVALRNRAFQAWWLHLSQNIVRQDVGFWNAGLKETSNYVHIVVGTVRQGEGFGEIAMSIRKPLKSSGAREAAAVWDPLFRSPSVHAHQDYEYLVALARQMERVGMLPAGYSSQLSPPPLWRRWDLWLLVAAGAIAGGAALALGLSLSGLVRVPSFWGL